MHIMHARHTSQCSEDALCCTKSSSQPGCFTKGGSPFFHILRFPTSRPSAVSGAAKERGSLYLPEDPWLRHHSALASSGTVRTITPGLAADTACWPALRTKEQCRHRSIELRKQIRVSAQMTDGSSVGRMLQGQHKAGLVGLQTRDEFQADSNSDSGHRACKPS